MGSGASRLLSSCARAPSPPPSPAGAAAFDASAPLDEALGHSFCYSHHHSLDAAAFRTISGAAVSANSSAPVPVYGALSSSAAAFQSSSSFSALPLQLSAGAGAAASGPLDRGYFLSGPIERGALSGPLDPVPFSGPLVKRKLSRRFRKPSFLLRRSISEKNRPWVVPLRSFHGGAGGRKPEGIGAPEGEGEGAGVQWAHGRAGEDRVHVVVSEEHRWLFVGIYDGFNGPEAPDFLVAHLYRAVFHELRGIFYEDLDAAAAEEEAEVAISASASKRLWQFLADDADDGGELDFSGSGRFALSLAKLKVWFPKWSSASEEKSKESNAAQVVGADRVRRRTAGPVADHQTVLVALARALASTEAAYLDMTDRSMDSNPELALMGSCLLVVLMRDEDVYVMNLGDSRAIVAQCRPPNGDDDFGFDHSVQLRGHGGVENGEGLEIEVPDRAVLELEALQLSTDHSTSIEEEVLRIKHEHPGDDRCIVNDRVKGRLKVTRAFGAGYLKQAKWNNGLLEMFRNEFVGNAPYISCIPSLCHHKLGTNDQFVVLSSDGLYQYLSNEEVVLHVENFMERFPDGDPAQSLIEELLFRAAKRAGMDLYELLDIPQGDRRKYHDDVTVMVISLEGRIWKSSGTYV